MFLNYYGFPIMWFLIAILFFGIAIYWNIDPFTVIGGIFVGVGLMVLLLREVGENTITKTPKSVFCDENYLVAIIEKGENDKNNESVDESVLFTKAEIINKYKKNSSIKLTRKESFSAIIRPLTVYKWEIIFDENKENVETNNKN